MCLAPGGADKGQRRPALPQPAFHRLSRGHSGSGVPQPFLRDRQLLPRARTVTSWASVPLSLGLSFSIYKSKGLGFLPEALSGSNILGLSGLIISGSKSNGLRPLNPLVVSSHAQQGCVWLSLWTQVLKEKIEALIPLFLHCDTGLHSHWPKGLAGPAGES